MSGLLLKNGSVINFDGSSKDKFKGSNDGLVWKSGQWLGVRIIKPSVKRNPRQVSSTRLESAVNYNRKWAKHFSNIYSYPDWQELESIGLEAITNCCQKVKESRRQKGFMSLCRVSVRNAVINHVKRTGKQAAVLSKARRKAEILTRDPDYYPKEDNDD